ncbi:MAG TPA: hypothetical protein ENK55_10790 [Actinobacteria bacterium]|nr:hypothetical protein [Actinomycetota bacterium]
MTPSLSELAPRVVVGVLALVGLVGGAPVAEVVTTDLFIVEVDATVDEDVYVVAERALVEGTVDGDLVVLAGDVSVSGTVTGDLLVLSGGEVAVESGGVVDGSLRAAAREVAVAGSVGGDVLAVAPRVIVDGDVGRDLVVFGLDVDLEGRIDRDVRGRGYALGVGGVVGGHVDVAVERLVVADGAEIGGNLLYRSPRSADVAPGAEVGGRIVRLPARSNFVVGVFLAVARVIGVLGFVVAGILTLWLSRWTVPRAAGSVLRRPLPTLLVGVGVFVALPVAIVAFSATLVGLPVAVVLLLVAVAGVAVGPVPAVLALGAALTRGRFDLYGGFLVGAAAWLAAVFLLPFVGGLVYLAGLVWGLGGWAMGWWALRRRSAPPPVGASAPDGPDHSAR